MQMMYDSQLASFHRKMARILRVTETEESYLSHGFHPAHNLPNQRSGLVPLPSATLSLRPIVPDDL